MSTRRAPASGVFGPYSPEKYVMAADAGQVVWCTRCPTLGRRTALVQKTDAIGRVTERCPACDGVSPPRTHNPDEVFKLQALIGPAQLLPPCPAGVLRCQSCAWPVVGDARLCPRCELPGLSRKEIAQKHREREDREAAAAPPRPRPEMPQPMYRTRQAPADPKPKPAAKPGALARAVAKAERPARSSDGRARLSFKPKPCAEPSCRKMFQPTGGRSKFCEACR